MKEAVKEVIATAVWFSAGLGVVCPVLAVQLYFEQRANREHERIARAVSARYLASGVFAEPSEFDEAVARFLVEGATDENAARFRALLSGVSASEGYFKTAERRRENDFAFPRRKPAEIFDRGVADSCGAAPSEQFRAADRRENAGGERADERGTSADQNRGGNRAGDECRCDEKAPADGNAPTKNDL